MSEQRVHALLTRSSLGRPADAAAVLTIGTSTASEAQNA